MFDPSLGYSPYPSDRRKWRTVPTPTSPALVPFVTQREGEEAAPDNLILLPHTDGRLHLHYLDEDPRDRDLRGVLWARCSFNPLDGQGEPTGRPQWKLIHPYRQMMTMQSLRCQICTTPARTPLGLIFLAGPHEHTSETAEVLTNQPPVCARHYTDPWSIHAVIDVVVLDTGDVTDHHAVKVVYSRARLAEGLRRTIAPLPPYDLSSVP